MKETHEGFGDLRTGEKLICTTKNVDDLELLAKAKTV